MTIYRYKVKAKSKEAVRKMSKADKLHNNTPTGTKGPLQLKLEEYDPH